MPPHFIGIGAQKAGTTWLAHQISRHPDVWMPPRKELHYFDFWMNSRWERPFALRGLGRLLGKRPSEVAWRAHVVATARKHKKKYKGGRLSLRELLWDANYFFGEPSDGWYASLFRQGSGKITGEITPAYSTLEPEVIAHVHRLSPEARIIFMMRNPIERAYSAAVMELDRRGKTPEDVSHESHALLFESEDFTLRSDYLRTLANWHHFYPGDRIFVGFLEDVHFHPARLLARICDFIQVEPKEMPKRGFKRKIHTRGGQTMPLGVAKHLAHLYWADLVELSPHFGGYADFWLWCAEKILHLPDNAGEDEVVPYPFHESPWWEEWLQRGPASRDADISLQSRVDNLA